MTATSWPALSLYRVGIPPGAKVRLGRVSKAGQRDPGRLLVTGGIPVVRQAVRRGGAADPRLRRMLVGRSARLVAMALANRMAPITRALTTKKDRNRVPATVRVREREDVWSTGGATKGKGKRSTRRDREDGS